MKKFSLIMALIMTATLFFSSTVTVSAESKKIFDCEIEAANSIVYNKYPTNRVKVTIYDGNKKLTKGTDYTLDFYDDEDVGRAYVQIKGLNNYSGGVKRYYYIVPDAVRLDSKSWLSSGHELDWNDKYSADGYYVYVKREDEYIKIGDTQNSSFDLDFGSSKAYPVTLKENDKFYVSAYVKVKNKKYAGEKSNSVTFYGEDFSYYKQKKVANCKNTLSTPVESGAKGVYISKTATDYGLDDIYDAYIDGLSFQALAGTGAEARYLVKFSVITKFVGNYTGSGQVLGSGYSVSCTISITDRTSDEIIWNKTYTAEPPQNAQFTIGYHKKIYGTFSSSDKICTEVLNKLKSLSKTS